MLLAGRFPPTYGLVFCWLTVNEATVRRCRHPLAIAGQSFARDQVLQCCNLSRLIDKAQRCCLSVQPAFLGLSAFLCHIACSWRPCSGGPLQKQPLSPPPLLSVSAIGGRDLLLLSTTVDKVLQ